MYSTIQNCKHMYKYPIRGQFKHYSFHYPEAAAGSNSLNYDQFVA